MFRLKFFFILEKTWNVLSTTARLLFKSMIERENQHEKFSRGKPVKFAHRSLISL